MPILPEHKEILLAQSEDKTLAEWVEFFDSQYTKNQIYSFCYQQKKHIKKKFVPQEVRTYCIKQDYFKTWSHNMSYIFGFWFANGYIYGGKMFDITLHKRDKSILRDIAKELGYKGNLGDYVDKQCCRINFSCEVIYKDIIALGGAERVSFPKIPEEYVSDFIRGYFDGNGCIMDLKNHRVNSAFICGNRGFLKNLLKVLQEKAGIQNGSFDEESCSLRFDERDAIRLGNYIYKDNPELFLSRKKQKFIT